VNERLSPRVKHLIVIGVLGTAFLLPLRGLLRSQGPPMEEGFMLVFPEQLLHGDIPNRDFLHLYGPGSLWWLAALYKVFGTSLFIERLAALAQMVAVVVGVAGLARRWSTTMALTCGGLALVIIVPPIGLTALAWVGGVGLALLAILAGTAAIVPDRESRHAAWLAALSGALFAAALLFRADLVLASGLATVVLWRAFAAPQRRAFAASLAIGLTPYLVHVAVAGPGQVWNGMVIEPVFELRAGRRLPLPPRPGELAGFLQKAGDFGPEAKLDWPVPTLTSATQIFVWFVVLLGTAVGLVIAARWRARHDPGSLRTVTLGAVALLGVGLLPQALQRPDSAHLAWVSCVPLAFAPLGVRELLDRRAARSGTRLPVTSRRATSTGRRHDLIAAAVVMSFVALVIPRYILNSYADYSLQSFDVHRTAFRIERSGRVFYYGKQGVAQAAQAGLIPALETITRPGDSLVVATSDLRKTPYSDAYLYYLFPELDVGTRYIEMDPAIANAKDSGLRDEIAATGVVVLSSVWDDWNEPNASRDVIENGANEVVRERFVCVGEYGRRKPTDLAPVGFLYQLWIRRDIADDRGIGAGTRVVGGRPCTNGLAATPTT